MIRNLITIVTSSKKVWAIGLSIIALVGTLGYGILKLQALEATIEAREQRIELVENQYNGLLQEYNTLDTDFREFVTQVQRDLNEQRILNSDVRSLNFEYRQRVDDLERMFMYDSDGELRDWDDIFDNRYSALQRLVNERTRGIGRDFEEISNNQ